MLFITEFDARLELFCLPSNRISSIIQTDNNQVRTYRIVRLKCNYYIQVTGYTEYLKLGTTVTLNGDLEIAKNFSDEARWVLFVQ